MAMVRARQSAVLRVDGGYITVREGQAFDEDDPVVRAHPAVFEPPVEEATANPGQRRNVRRS